MKILHSPLIALLLLIIVTFSFPGKLKAQLSFEWAKALSGSNAEQAKALAVDTAGNVYTTGWFTDTVDFDPGPAAFNLVATNGSIFISKLDANGNLIWAKKVDGNHDNVGQSIVVNKAGDAFICGTFSSTADFDPGPGIFNMTAVVDEAFILKLDAAGNFQWAKKIGGPSALKVIPYAIAIDDSENILTTGIFHGVVDFNPDSAGVFNMASDSVSSASIYHDAFVCKLNSVGNFVFAKRIGAGTSASSAEGFGITADSAGNIFTTGGYKGTVDFDPGVGVHNLTTSSSQDGYILKLDASGNFQWVKNLVGTINCLVNAYAIKTDHSGNIVATGGFFGTIDFDPGAAVPQSFLAKRRDIYVLKLNASGNFLWVKTIGSTHDDEGCALTLDASGNICVTGYFSDTVDFDPGIGVNSIISNGGAPGNVDIFILKLYSGGDFAWAMGMGGSGQDVGLGIATDPASNVYTAGSFQGTMDCDPNPAVFNLIGTGVGLGAGPDNVYIHKIGQSTLNLTAENTAKINPTIFPNPATTALYIQGLAPTQFLNISVFDVAGKKLFTSSLSVTNNTYCLDVSQLNNGIYLYSIDNDSTNNVKGKFVVLK